MQSLTMCTQLVVGTRKSVVLTLLLVHADTFLIQTPNGSYRAPMLGEVCCQRPGYADTLDRIATMGAAAVYNPDTAATLAAEIQ